MISKISTLTMIFLLFGFLSLSSAQEEVNYPLTHDTTSLTSDEFRAALDYLGLQLERFTYEVPYKHQIRFTLQQFFRGRRQYAQECEPTFSLEAGRHVLTLFIHQENDTIDFAVLSEHIRNDVGSVSTNDCDAVTWSQLANVQLIEGEKVPIFVLAANPEGITGFRPDEPLEIIVTNYKLVVVVLAELKRD